MNRIVVVESEGSRSDSGNSGHQSERDSNPEREMVRFYSCFHVGQVIGHLVHKR